MGQPFEIRGRALSRGRLRVRIPRASCRQRACPRAPGNPANFVRLAPGVTGQSTGTYTSDNQTAVSISGGGAIQGGNEWIIDGVSDTVPLSTGSVVLVPTVDAVEEMQVSHPAMGVCRPGE